MLNIICQVLLNQNNLIAAYTQNMSIGIRFRQLRQQIGVSQEKIGELVGVTKGMVSQWESDLVTPPMDRLIELRKHHQFSFDWLLTGQLSTGAQIEQHLSVQQRQVWYRVGNSLAEPDEGTNGKK